MKRIIFLLLGVSLLLAGCKKKNQPSPSSSLSVPEIRVDTPTQGNVTYTYEYPAYLEAIQTVQLVARVSGFLEKMEYTAGQSVKAGQLLFTIEPQPYRDQLDAALAGMKSAEAQHAYAQAQYERMKEAMPGKGVSEIDFLQSESAVQTAAATVQTAAAQVNTTRTNLNYCYIKAPFDGRISRNTVDVKNFVAATVQPTTLATLYRDKVMYAYFNMAYAEYTNLPSVDDLSYRRTSLREVSICDAENPSRQWRGQLDYTAPDVDLQTGTVTVRAIVENPHAELLSGMYVKITVPYKEVFNALLIPETSIGTNQGGRYIYTVGSDNKINLQPVKVGILTPNNRREIIHGVTPDSRYVVEALISVRPGMSVKPITAPSSRPPTQHASFIPY
ncbi:MAG: efflux RND transporter periplasmic adaptor subunit [Odoribacter sp.]